MTGRAAIAWALVSGAWAAVVLVGYFSDTWPGAQQWLSIVSLLRPPTPAAAGAAFHRLYLTGWLCAFMVLAGRPLLKRLQITSLAEELLLAGGLGAGLAATALFLLGVLGLWYRPLLAVLAVFATVALVPANRDLLRRVQAAWRGRAPAERWGLTDWACLAVIALGVAVCLVGALGPEIFYDSLVYHLALPKLWVLRHRIVPTPSVCYSGFPALMEMHYGLALAVSDETVAKLLHFAAGLGTLATLGLVARRCAGRRAALLAVVLFLTPPLLVLEFGRAFVDLGSCFFVALAIWSLARGAGSDETAPRWTMLSGAFAGFALATKYTNVTVLLAVGAGAWVLRRSWRPVARWWRQWAIVSALAGAIVAPWLVRNAVFYGNPVYPMLDGVVPGLHMSGFNAAGLRADAQGRTLATAFGSWRGFLEWSKEPWTITMSGRNDGNFMGAALLLSLPTLLFVPWSRRLVALSAAAAVIWFSASLASSMVRFRLPALALACVVFAVGWAAESSPRLWRQLGAWLLVAVGLTNVVWAGWRLWLEDGWRVVQGRVSKESYLQNPHLTYPSPCFAAAQFINASTPAGAGCMVLGDARTFYLERPILSASVFDLHPLLAWANQYPDGDALALRVQREGMHYILLNAAEARRTRSYLGGSLTAHGRAVFDEFWQKHTHEVYRDQGSGAWTRRLAFVFEVVPDRLALEPDRPRVVDPWTAALGEDDPP